MRAARAALALPAALALALALPAGDPAATAGARSAGAAWAQQTQDTTVTPTAPPATTAPTATTAAPATTAPPPSTTDPPPSTTDPPATTAPSPTTTAPATTTARAAPTTTAPPPTTAGQDRSPTTTAATRSPTTTAPPGAPEGSRGDTPLAEVVDDDATVPALVRRPPGPPRDGGREPSRRRAPGLEPPSAAGAPEVLGPLFADDGPGRRPAAPTGLLARPLTLAALALAALLGLVLGLADRAATLARG